jgi:hypothetical protein
MDLNDNKIEFEQCSMFECDQGWYNLIVEYSGERIEIMDIKINDESIEHYLYTGFFTESSTGKVFQPANAVWTEGYYSIWIHTEIGFLVGTLSKGIRNGDFGKYLFDDYMLTVDKSTKVTKGWPEITQSYFRHGSGPRWWRKDKKHTPYEPLPREILQDIDKNKLMKDLDLDCKIQLEHNVHTKKDSASSNTMYAKAIRRKAEYPYIDWNDINSEMLKQVAKRIGFRNLLNVTLQTAKPGQSFRPHVDDHYNRECRQHIEGPVVFIWNLATNTQGHLFKLGDAGLVPLDNGAFFNQFYFDHATINDSDSSDRPLLIIHGERNKTISYV